MWDRFKYGQLIKLDKLASSNRLTGFDARMPSWKEINSDFTELIHPDDQQCRKVYFVSHRWDEEDHPDPRGWQLKALRNFAESCLSRHEDDACIWLDYMSLPQKPRTANEEAIFRSGLENIWGILGSASHALLVSKTGDTHYEGRDNMLSRGWILFETFIVRARNIYSYVIYERDRSALNPGAEQRTLDYAADLTSIVAIDRAEFIHAWFEKHKIACTNGSDLAYLSTLLHEELTQYRYETPPPGIELAGTLLLRTMI
jgi:hypothetical protein